MRMEMSQVRPGAFRLGSPIWHDCALEGNQRVDPFSAALRDIASIPGALYSCVAEDVTGHVLAEHGRAGPDPAAAVRWGSGLRAALHASGGLEDVMITAAGTYHLLRLVRADSRTVLVLLSVDRVHGNLALARRVLGEVRFDVADPAVPQRTEATPLPVAPIAVAVPVKRAVAARAATALPVRTPRRPLPLPDQTVRRPGATLSAVPPPRRPVAPPAPIVAAAPAAEEAPAGQPVSVPTARGWSDDLYTMSRLLDALRRMK